jgi:DNA-binding beta-propeller fold protein YncE
MPVSTILLGGKPEFARSNCRGKIYVNIESTNEVVEIDTQNFTVTRRFYIVPGEEPVGLALDVDHHIVFSGCRNKYMTILDTDANRVVGTVQIGEGVDGNEFDPVTGYVFSSNRDGTLNIIQQTFPGTYEIAQTLETQKGSRTMVLDPVSHNIYLPAAKFADTPLNPGERPKPIPDTFEIIVVSTATVH